MVQESEKLSFLMNDIKTEIKEEFDDNNYQEETFTSKRGRLIVRNLPFKNLSEDKLKQWFKDFGEIKEVKLLKKEDGKFKGCGFIEFAKVESAAKAVEKANEREISGRKIIVDWAVPKNVYAERIKSIKQEIIQEMDRDDSSSSENFSEDTKPEHFDKSKKKIRNSNHFKNIKSEDVNEIEIGSQQTHFKSENKGKVLKSNDVEEGKTLFIRNIPFSATNEDLKQCFSTYGAVEYALICMDKLTEHSKGTGFVKFKKKENADLCLSQKNKISLEDYPLTVSLAVTKENLENKKDKKEAKDSRNLYLAREGSIMAGFRAAQGVSATDMAKRVEIEHWKTQILKNLHMFVSDRRLVVHNLPSNYDDAKLRALFLKHTHPKAVIKEAKVMRDKKKMDANGLGASKELGFVTFSCHEDALLALRKINNNPKIFSVKRRPIVTFSIESKAVLNMKQKRLEKSRQRLGIQDDKTNKLMTLNRKQRRSLLRREKIIERRREAKKAKQGIEGEKEDVKKGIIDKKVATKRKLVAEDDSKNKIPKRTAGETNMDESENQYCGIVSEPGKKVKMRSRFRLRNQIRVHKQQLHNEKLKRKSKLLKKKSQELIKQPKQKQGEKKLNNDLRTSKFLSKHRKALEGASAYKKWDEK